MITINHEYKCLKCRQEINLPFVPNDTTLVDALDLSNKVTNLLKANNINTVSVLLSKTANDLYRIRGFGRKSVNETRESLDNFGLMLKDDENNPPLNSWL